MNRSLHIDTLRGFAIVLMFLAHTIPCLDPSIVENNFFVRLLCSLAAPIFLFLVGYNFKPSGTSFIKALSKVLIILSCAVLVDTVVWDTLPFYSFDILYTIGFSLLLLFLLRSLTTRALISVCIVIFTTSLLYHSFGSYPEQVHEPTLEQIRDIQLIEILKNLFFDGWFPLFPWFLFPLLGQLFVRLPHLRPTRYWLFFALPGFLVFTYLTSLQHNSMRAYSIELFYPANSVYLICAFFYLICIWYLFANIRWEKFNFLSSMGRVSLFLYVFHLFILHSTFDWLYLLLKSSMLLSFLTYFLFFCIISAVLNWLKSTANYPKNSLILGVILGK